MPKNYPPTIWTREALTAIWRGFPYFYLHRQSVYSTFSPLQQSQSKIEEIESKYNNIRSIYYQIPKCASSSIVGMLKKYGEIRHNTSIWKQYIEQITSKSSIPSRKVSADCAFGFVRDPLSRLITSYYTENFFLWKMKMCFEYQDKSCSGKYEEIKNKYKWWNVYGEPERFRTWINETFIYANEFGSLYPQQHHNTMLSYFATFDGSDLQYIGKIEYFDKHFRRLFEFNPLCKVHWNYSHYNISLYHSMKLEGVWSDKPNVWTLDKEYQEWLNLTHWNIHLHSIYQLPAYMAITPSLFNQIVEHYWQDYVCFGYEPNYPNLGLFYTGTFKQF